MLKRLYLWTLEKAAHPLAERWLALIAFLESSVFPIPPDVMLAPMCLARPARAFRLALIATFASVVGAAAGWLIGAGFFDAIGRPVLALYGAEAAFADLALEFNERGLWIVLAAGFTPIPFKLITIASGATGMSLPVMLTASVVARGARFFLLATLLKLFGEPMKAFLDRHFGLVTIAVAVVGLLGFFAVRFLF